MVQQLSTYFNKTYKGALVINEKNLRSLVSVIEESLDPQKIGNFNVYLKNGFNMDFKAVDDIFKENNSGKKCVNRIRIKLSSGHYSSSDYKNVEISFMQLYSTGYIELSMNGEDRDWVFVTATKIEEKINALKQNYSFLYFLNENVILQIISFFVTLVFILFVITKAPYLIRVIKNLSELALIPILSLTFLINNYLLKFLYYLFPNFVFAIGDKADHENNLLALRKSIFWVIIVGLIMIVFVHYVFQF